MKFKILFCFLLFSMIFPINNFSFADINKDIMNNIDHLDETDNILDKYYYSFTNNGLASSETENNSDIVNNNNLVKLSQNASSVPEPEFDIKSINDQFIVQLNNNDETTNSLENPTQIIAKIQQENPDIDSSSFKIINEFTTGFKGFTIKVFDNKIIDLLRENPSVKEIVPDMKFENAGQSHLFQSHNFKVEGQVIPTAIDRIDADLSTAKSGDGHGALNVDIAILDTGISFSHPDLNLYRDVTFVPGTTNGDDDNGHGSAVAGLAAAKDNDIGIVGVAPGAKLWAVKILDENQSGTFSSILQGLQYVLQNADEIDVVNMSFIGSDINDLEKTLIEQIFDAGIVMAASARGGEHYAGGPGTPQAFPETIATTEMYDSDGKCGGYGIPLPSAGSFYGGRDDTSRQFILPNVDMIAPAADVLSTYLGNSYIYFGQTSAAAPIVSGAAALYLSTHEDATPEEVLEALQDEGSTKDTKCDGQGHGYLTFEDDPRHGILQDFFGVEEPKFPPLVYVGNF